MKQEDFKNFDLHTVFVKRNVDEDGETFLWTDIHHMQFIKGSMKMKFRFESFGEKPFRAVDMGKRGAKLSDVQSLTLQPLYTGPIKIKAEKYKDLIDQLNFIPPCYHDFYTSLKHEKK